MNNELLRDCYCCPTRVRKKSFHAILFQYDNVFVVLKA